MSRAYDGVTLVLSGAAGQGVQTIESILTNVLQREGFFVSATKEYMSRIRGGSNSTEIRVTHSARSAYVRSMDLCLVLDALALKHMERRIGPETIVIGDAQHLRAVGAKNLIDVPMEKIAKELGNPLFVNTVAAGVVIGILGAELEGLRQYMNDQFSRKGDEIVQKNIEAAEQGHGIGRHLLYMRDSHLHVSSHKNDVAHTLLLNGNDALGLGFLRGGVNFLASYPMSPGTGILTFFAERAARFGLAVEQAEDEIAAINMGLGASYAGARALVTTSGGGFALMEESVSLAGMIETPIVIHIAMRPGPATGLPTRTEQADLNLALYSGHGEFPRALYTPGDAVEAFEVGQEAVRVADKFQSPVFVLSDQYFLDMVQSVSLEDLRITSWDPTIVETTPEYRRYEVTDDGVSPRGVPGYGTGLVVVDSDEHTEDGHLTEDLDARVRMMDKRLRKFEGLQAEVLPPVFAGADPAETILVGWGSTKPALTEALEISKRDDVKYIHFKQVWPLPEKVKTYFKGAKKVVVVENNATGQFASQLRLAGVKVTDRWLKYDGEPFAVEELVEKIQTV